MTAVLVVVTLAGGCATAPPPAAGAGAELALGAVGLIGVRYRYGGEDPASGLDCSGLVRYVARTTVGLQLPRQTEAISRAGVPVDRDRLQSGDLVFFNTLGAPNSHVGIYLGDGQFVHAPTQGGQVRIESLSQSYWSARFDGARRLIEGPEAAARFATTSSASGKAAADSGTVWPLNP